MQLRTTAPTHRTPIAPLPAGQSLCDAPVDAALVCAEIFISERNEDDSDERKYEDEVRGYVPLSKDDTGILDLGVPARTVRTWIWMLQVGTYHSMCIEQVGPMSISPPPCPPWP